MKITRLLASALVTTGVMIQSRTLSRLSKILAVALIASAATITASHAALKVTFDMKAVQTGLTATSDGVVDISPDGRTVQAVPGAHVVLQLVATLNAIDSDLSNDTLVRVIGSFVTFGASGDAVGSLRGDASTNPGINNVPNFTGIGAKSGLNNVELSSPADGIFDVGGTSITAQTNYFQASSNAVTGTVGQSLVVGETVLTIQSGRTSVTFKPRTVANSGAAANRLNVAFKIDGFQYNLNGDGSPTNSNTPDPTAFQLNPVSVVTGPDTTTFPPTLTAPASDRFRRTR